MTRTTCKKCREEMRKLSRSAIAAARALNFRAFETFRDAAKMYRDETTVSTCRCFTTWK